MEPCFILSSGEPNVDDCRLVSRTVSIIVKSVRRPYVLKSDFAFFSPLPRPSRFSIRLHVTEPTKKLDHFATLCHRRSRAGAGGNAVDEVFEFCF